MSDKANFIGKVVLVTGAGSGIGKAIATAFGEAGAYVIINDMMDTGQEVAKGLKGTFIKADLASMEDTRRLCREALSIRGRVDILVNNAGFQYVSPVDEFDEDMWAKMVQVMLIAPFQLTKHLLPPMKQAGWGRIINISSIHGLVASPFKSAYIAAKHGLIGLTRTVAHEVGEYGITVNAICPAYVRTPLVEKQIPAQAKKFGISEDKVVQEIMMSSAAIKRLIEPEEVAGLVLFLASDAARSMTGSAYTIDVGWTAR